MTYIKNLHFMELYVVTVKKLLLSNKPHSQIQKKKCPLQKQNKYKKWSLKECFECGSMYN